MNRSFVWITTARWSRVAYLSRVFGALALIMLAAGNWQQANRLDKVYDANDHLTAEARRLYEEVTANRLRIDQLEGTLNDAHVPIPPPPTTTTTTIRRRTSTTVRPAPRRTTTTGRGPTTRPTTTTTTCAAPGTVPKVGVCPTVPEGTP